MKLECTLSGLVNQASSLTPSEIELMWEGEPGRVRLAGEPRAGTTMSVTWIGQWFNLCSRGYPTWLLCRGPQGQPGCI